MSLDRISQSSDRSVDSNDWTMPRSQMHKQRRQEKQRQKVITGNNKSSSQFGSFKGAPEPSRDLFLFRVDQASDVSDIKTFLLSKQVEIRSLSCASHDDAKFKSFKLTVGITDFNRVFSDSFWPSGVRIRRFIPPRSSNQREPNNSEQWQ